MFQPGQAIWWLDNPRRGYGAFSPVIAVFVKMCVTRAGIAVLLRDGTWRPKRVEVRSVKDRIVDGQ